MVKVIRTAYENGNIRYDLVSDDRPGNTMFGDVSFNASKRTGCKPEVGWSSTFAQPVKETQSITEIPIIRYVISCTLCKVVSWASSENLKEDFDNRKRGIDITSEL